MDWVILSFGVILVASANCLVARKLLVKGISGALINLINFFACFVFFLLFAALSGKQLVIPFSDLAAVIILSVFFNYIGNVFYMKSIAGAPNPGYGLTIIKSNVIMTTLLAALFLRSEISIKNVLAIIIVLVFMALVFFDNSAKSKSRSGGKWILPSVAAFFCFSFYTLSIKYLLERGVDSTVFLVYMCGASAAIFYFEAKKARGKIFDVGANSNFFLMFGAIASIAGTIFFTEAVKVAPNPGYVGAFDAASSAVVVLGAAWLFKDHLSRSKLVGVLGVLSGLIVLLL